MSRQTPREERPGADGGGGHSQQTPEVAPDSLSGVVARGAWFAGAGYGLSQLITFGAYLVLARLATPASFGEFASGALVVGVGAVLGESGILAALIQRRGTLEPALNSGFLMTVAGGVGLSLLALASAPLVGLVFHNARVGDVAAAMSGLLFFRLIMIVPNAVLQRNFSVVRRVVIDPLSSLAFAAVAIPAAAAGLGVWALVIGTYASVVLLAVSAWLFAGWRPRVRLASRATWRELARFGRPVMAGNLIRTFVLQVPILALGRARGPSAVGQFTYAARTAVQPLGAVVEVSGYFLLPAFSRVAAFDSRFRAAVCKSVRWLSLVCFPACMLLVPLGTPVVVLVFGERWLPAGHAAALLGVYSAALSLDLVASEAWKAAAHTDMLPRMHGLSLLLTATFVIALVIPFGLVGVAIGMSLSAVGVAAYAVRGMSHALGIPLRNLLRELWPPAVASCVMAAVLFCVEHFLVHADQRGTIVGLLLLALEAVAGAVLYSGALRLLAPESTRELAGALRLLTTRIAGARRRTLDAPA